MPEDVKIESMDSEDTDPGLFSGRSAAPSAAERPENDMEEVPPGQGEADGYALGAVACAVGSFVVPVVLAVAALILARASEVRFDANPAGANRVDSARSDNLIAAARMIAWANIALVSAFLAFLLLGIAGKVAS